MTSPSGYSASFLLFLPSSPCSLLHRGLANLRPVSGPPNNLLFFGSFATMAQQEHVNALKGPLHDNEQARTLIIRDIYQIGKVLDKKYVNLRLSYLSLGAGIIISAISFSIQHLGVL